MRLTKGEINELLLRISEDNFQYGIIFKLIYIYGKEGKPVITLKWRDIDFDKNTIRFKNKLFPLHSQVKEDLLVLQDETLGGMDDYLFLDDGLDGDGLENCIDILRKKLRYYLGNTVKGLDVCLRIKRNSLSISDLRRLRGQHLLFDGVPLSVVMELFLQSNGTVNQFKRFLEYDDVFRLLHPCDCVDCLLMDYTDLGIFDFDSHRVRKDYFMVSNRSGDSLVLCLDSDEGLVFVGEGEESIRFNPLLKSEVEKLYNSGCLDGLLVLRDYEFKSLDGLSFVRM